MHTREIPQLGQARAKGNGSVSMHIVLTGEPGFLLDTLSETATRGGHQVSQFASNCVAQGPGTLVAMVEPIDGTATPQNCDVLIVAAIGQPTPDPAKFIPPGIEAKTIALIIQDKQPVAALPPPFSPSLTVITDLPVGPGDPNGRLTYWARRMANQSTVLAFGKAARKVEPFLDVRDSAQWIIDGVETGRTGKFRLNGEPTTIGQLLETARPDAGSASDAEVIYVDDNFLRDSGVDPLQALPLWSPATESLQPAGSEQVVKADARIRSLKHTVQDATDWEAAHRTQTTLIYLGLERERELLNEWPDYDPTGEKRRRHARHVVSVWISVVLTLGAVITCFIDSNFFDKALATVTWIDNTALTILSTFHPGMVSSFYYVDANQVSQHIPGVDIHFWPLTAVIFIISMICATPWVLVGLYQQGGVVNLLGGLLTLVFGILAWPVLARIFGLVGKSFPRAFPALEANADEHGEIVVGRTLLAIGVPIYVWLRFFGNLSFGQIAIAELVMCAVSLWVLVTLVLDKIISKETSIFGEGPMVLLSLAASIAMTLAMGVAISGSLQLLLEKTIHSFTLLVTELVFLISQVTLAVSMAFWTALDRLHLAKSVGETALDVHHLSRFHIRPRPPRTHG